MKGDDNATHMSAQRLQSFVGYVLRLLHESDYKAWRSGIDLLLKDPTFSDLQGSKKIFESRLTPAADMVKHFMPETPPMAYLDP